MALIAAAVAAVLAGSAYAQEQPAGVDRSDEARVARGDTQLQSVEQYLQSRTLRASQLIGMELQNRSGDNLGEVEDLVTAAAPGQDMQLIVAVGGFAGADEKLVAIPIDEVQISADGDELYTNRTRDQLAAAPPVALERRNVDARQGSTSENRQTPAAQRADDQDANDARSETRQGAPDTARERDELGDDDDSRANREAPNGGAAQAPNAGAGQARPGSTGTGQLSATALNERRVADLIGAEVIGADGDKVGEIDDIVLSTAGADSVRAVLQVGGLAGIGEKRIALPLRQLQIDRSADNEPRVRVAMNLDALESQPEFEYEERSSIL
jgi:sporulation protein YlmC with PRC-barrel domain